MSRQSFTVARPGLHEARLSFIAGGPVHKLVPGSLMLRLREFAPYHPGDRAHERHSLGRR